MAISTPDPRRRVKLPRKLPRGRGLQPYSRVDAPYFRSPGFFVRIGGLAVVVAVALALLLLRAWSIQVLHGPQYAKQATSQAYRTVDLRGTRGAIVDRHGKRLAVMVGRLVVSADANSLGERDEHGVWAPSADGKRALRRLAQLSGTPVRTLEERIGRALIRSPFAPVVVLPHPRRALTDYLQERGESWPAFKVIGEYSRSYPQGSLGSEFLGLLGEVSAEELTTPRYAHAKAGEIVGQTGVEKIYDRQLNPGLVPARVRVDSMGRITGPLEIPKQKAPPTLRLTVDARLQRAAEKAVRDGIALARANGQHPTGGSAVAIDPSTGAILALASVPTFDQVRAANDRRYLVSLYDPKKHPEDPTLNRAIAGVYPTGSTFKPIVAEAALSAGLITPETPLLCSGSFSLGGFVFHNVEAGVYSEMSLRTALAESCDTWFYRLGDRIWQADPARRGTLIQQWARKFGFGSSTGIDLSGDNGGLVPTPSWFLKTNKFPWTEGQTVNLSIGQGALQASPLQLAVAYSALVNGGKVVRPHVADAVIRDGKVDRLRFPPVRRLKLVDADAIREGLHMAAHDAGGTSAFVFGNFPVDVAGKTGTAETCRGCDDHSWYASFAPYRHPKLVVVAMIEHGGFGASAAAPTVKEIYEAYFHVGDTTP
ncbi:MAG TPA: penicillin-binding transpeptidase domain-containing protein [Gaiellaceae bacterium]|nr:penicillin-binding transpeptidase domain-containing protein [Gaiellaceae bacterium]